MVYHEDMIPINSPQRFLEQVDEDLRLSISRVLASGSLVLGPENEALDVELSEYINCEYTVLVGNGTDALEIALRCLEVKPGTKVLTVANAGAYASTAITLVGAGPIFVDVNEKDLQMNPNDLAHVLTGLDERPSAIVVTHLYGQAAPIVDIRRIADLAGIPVVEDCAQSMGASVLGQKLGSFGDIATTSFYPTKNLAGIGDGGALFTSDEKLAERAISLRQYGWSSRYNAKIHGGRNSRLDEIQAATIRLGLKHLDARNKKRREIHALYREAAESENVNFPHSHSESFVAHLAVLTTSNRSRIRKFLGSRGIGSDIHYPIPDHKQKAFEDFFTRNLPVTEKISGEIVSVPLFPELTLSEIETVVEALRDFRRS